MIRTVLTCLLLALPATSAGAGCAGQNLLPTLSAADRDGISAAIDALDYGRGNFWRATRGDAVIHIVGTYHFDDPRHDAILDRIGGAIDAASVVLVEAGPKEQAELQAELARRPDRIFTLSGPTLPERLEETDWQALAAAMQDRGVPAFMAAKMQPWYVSMLLGVPPCAMDQMNGQPNGLDHRIIERAGEKGIPVRPLEPFDTVFTLFDDVPAEDQVDMIRTTLAMGDRAEDYSATLTEAYFAEDVRVTWELGRLAVRDMPGETPESVDAELADMEERLMFRRNRGWIPVIEAAADEGPVFVAFGALHLSGRDGVLALLERDGYRLERLPF